MIDDWVRKNSNKKFDENGNISKAGKLDQLITTQIIDNFNIESYSIEYDSILKLSIIWVVINWSSLPAFEIFPFSSNFLFEFFLTQSSIKQFPGPKSKAVIFSSRLLDLLLIFVRFVIPPILMNPIGNPVLNFSLIILDKR